MRHILATVFGAVLAAGPAWALETVPHASAEAIWVYAEALAADSYCPAYRVNNYKLTEFIKSRGFDHHSITTQFPETYQQISDMVFRTMSEMRRSECDDAFDRLGDDGEFPHILVRR